MFEFMDHGVDGIGFFLLAVPEPGAIGDMRPEKETSETHLARHLREGGSAEASQLIDDHLAYAIAERGAVAAVVAGNADDGQNAQVDILLCPEHPRVLGKGAAGSLDDQRKDIDLFANGKFEWPFGEGQDLSIE